MEPITISGALARAIRDQKIGFRQKGEGVKASVAQLAGVPESSVRLVSGGGQWHVAVEDAEARARFLEALEDVKAKAEQAAKDFENQREREEREFQEFCADN